MTMPTPPSSVLHVVVQLRRLRRAAADERRARLGEERLRPAAPAARRGTPCGTACPRRRCVTPSRCEHRDRGRGHEAPRRSRATQPAMSAGEQPADPTDVREREHERVAVVGGQLERGDHRVRRRARRSCRCAARPSGRRWCPTCRRPSATGRRSRRRLERLAGRGAGSVDGSPSGSVPVARRAPRGPAASAAIVPRHRLVVEPAPHRRARSAASRRSASSMKPTSRSR